MTRSLENRDGLSAADAEVLEHIQSHGWHVSGIFRSKGEPGPEWAFSVGLFHSFAHPEVIVFGLKLDICMSVVNEIGGQVKAGKHYGLSVEYGDILNDPYKCVFRPVQREHYHDFLGIARWFYEGNSFLTMQCFWPDKAGNFPWNKECGSFVRDAQPLLFLPATGLSGSRVQ